MMRRPLGLSLVCLLSLSACGGPFEDVPEDGDLVEFERYGGVAGFTDRLVVDEGGGATLHVRNEQASVRLPRAELRDLNAAFSEIDLEQLPTRDCQDDLGPIDELDTYLSANGVRVDLCALKSAGSPPAFVRGVEQLEEIQLELRRTIFPLTSSAK